jgi:molybdate transport system substrate-binding protein
VPVTGRGRRLVLVLACFVCAAAPAAQPHSLTIAAASDLRSVLPSIVASFEGATGHTVVTTFGASGNFYAQIQNGAPFDLFFSADIEYPRRLEAEGLVEKGSVSTYAVGRLALWTRQDSGVDVKLGLPMLLDARVRRIAIANPATAPYGRAAVAALQHEQLYDRVKAKLVLGENVAQAAQFVDSGNADAGIVAESLVLDPAVKERGVFAEIPPSFHPTIEQAVGVVQASARKPAAHAFLAFMRTPAIVRLMTTYGFSHSAVGSGAR